MCTINVNVVRRPFYEIFENLSFHDMYDDFQMYSTCIILYQGLDSWTDYSTIYYADTDDEYFCDNINRTLPGSLVQGIPDPNVDANPMLETRNGATFVTSLLQPALLLVIMLAILLFH